MVGLKKELSNRIPVTEKLKEKEAAHTLIVADLQAAANASKGYRLEVIRLQEEVDRLRKADEERQAEIESL